MDDVVYLKHHTFYILYQTGKSEDGTVYDRPCLTIVRNEPGSIPILENKFYDDEAVELYIKLTDSRKQFAGNQRSDSSYIREKLSELIEEYKKDQDNAWYTHDDNGAYFTYEKIIYDLEEILNH